MNLLIRGPKKYPMYIFWNGEEWMDVVHCGYSSIGQWVKDLKSVGYPIGLIKKP